MSPIDPALGQERWRGATEPSGVGEECHVQDGGPEGLEMRRRCRRALRRGVHFDPGMAMFVVVVGEERGTENLDAPGVGASARVIHQTSSRRLIKRMKL